MSTSPPPPPPYTPPSAMGPPEVLPEGGTRLPWEERDRLGILEALIETIRLLVTEPFEAFSRLRRDGDVTSPILFGIILSWLSVLLTQIWQVTLGSAFRSLFRGFEGFGSFPREPGMGVIIATFVITPIFVVIGLFLFAAIQHLFLMMVGATDRSPTGFEGTLKVYAYSQVAGLATVVPILGSVVFVVWAIVLAVIGYSTVHRTTTGKVLIAVLIPFFLCCACVFLVAVLFGAVLSAILAGMVHWGM